MTSKFKCQNGTVITVDKRSVKYIEICDESGENCKTLEELIREGFCYEST